MLLVFLTTSGFGEENIKLKMENVVSRIQFQALKWMFKSKKAFIKYGLTY